jgi:hypothetical protein
MANEYEAYDVLITVNNWPRGCLSNTDSTWRDLASEP